MKKLYVLLGTLLISMCAGCSEDPNSRLINETMSIMGSTTSSLDQTAKTINDAVAEANKDGKPLSIAAIAKAKKEAEDLKNWARELQDRKTKAENRRDNVTSDQREDYERTYKGQFQQAMIAVSGAQRKLDKALSDAEKYNEEWRDPDPQNATKKTVSDALVQLRQAIQDSRNDFAVLTKRQA